MTYIVKTLRRITAGSTLIHFAFGILIIAILAALIFQFSAIPLP